jgi:hypothetical protein
MSLAHYNIIVLSVCTYWLYVSTSKLLAFIPFSITPEKFNKCLLYFKFLLFYYLSVQMNTGYYGLDVSRHLASTTTLSALGKNYVALNL